MSDSPKYWFNLRTKQVELGLKSSSEDRIGPFDTEAEAANAEAIVKARSQAWRQQESEED
ncbi:MAG: SPOR domain-containing protein [Actinobacteria bacterium]|uniref:Unannotated protein n=1 Tax=freshwater metagenome TaxID=449393 RepID=A0A6J6JCK3_9ZZZZ|nr:SPOR domain-containing protein [Actinomycetota bacterium]MSZ17767.1 SPOR domain-containing protein [Actinomycetota bacterium]